MKCVMWCTSGLLDSPLAEVSRAVQQCISTTLDLDCTRNRSIGVETIYHAHKVVVNQYIIEEILRHLGNFSVCAGYVSGKYTETAHYHAR